jgi:hypothetical protein
VNTLNKQQQTADNWCSSSLGVGRGVSNSLPEKTSVLQRVYKSPGLEKKKMGVQ